MPCQISRKKQSELYYFFILGIFSGFLAKYVDTIPSNGAIGSLINIISNISSRIGIWVLLPLLLLHGAEHPEQGQFMFLPFFAGMLLAYYIYSMKLFNFFPVYYFVRWGINCLNISDGCICCLV